jgi:hypothetical protein
MVRTQVQLSEGQLAAMRRLAAAEGTSVADLVRRAVDALLERERAGSVGARRERALAAAGRFASGRADVSEHHDQHLGEAFRS